MRLRFFTAACAQWAFASACAACSSGTSTGEPGANEAGAPNEADSSQTPSDAATPALEGGGRTISCAALFSEQSRLFTGSATPGSWGSVPASLQQAPAGTMFCGAFLSDAGDNTYLFTSSLSPQALHDAYMPIVSGAGCTLGAASGTSSQGIITFECPGSKLGTITLYPTDGYFILTYG